MKYQRWVACGDNHGDNVDPGTLKAFKEFLSFWKPHIRIHAGDNWDFRWLRSKADDEERRQRIDLDFEAGEQFLYDYKPDVFLLGNHDWRLWKCEKDCTEGKTLDLATRMMKDAKKAIGGAQVYEYDKRKGVHQLGDYRLLHGYNTGVYAVKNATLHYGPMIMWHIHAPDMVSVPRLERTVGYSSGCLCRLDMDYNRAQLGTLRQNNGWMYGLVSATGKTTVWSAQRDGGSFYLPSEMREVKCVA